MTLTGVSLAVTMVGLLAGAGSPPGSAQGPDGLEVPEASITEPAGGAVLPRGPNEPVRRCLVYARYAVLWTDDGSLGGVANIQVRERAKGQPPAELCAATFAGRVVLEGDPAPVSGGAPLGLLDQWLILGCVQCNQWQCGAGVVDLSSGRKVSDFSFVDARPMRFERGAGGGSVTYWMALDQGPAYPRCVPVGPDRDRCWRLLREQAGVPAKVALPAPDCERAAREVAPGEDAEPAVRVSIKVRRSLVDGAVTYLKVPPACQPGWWN